MSRPWREAESLSQDPRFPPSPFVLSWINYLISLDFTSFIHSLEQYNDKIIVRMLLLLLLSRFSHVQLCVTPQTAAHQDPLSLGFSRQEHWSGLPFPSPIVRINKIIHNSMYSVCNEYPTNLNYYCSFRDKSLGNYFIASELKVSARNQNKVQIYYAKIL